MRSLPHNMFSAITNSALFNLHLISVRPTAFSGSSSKKKDHYAFFNRRIPFFKCEMWRKVLFFPLEGTLLVVGCQRCHTNCLFVLWTLGFHSWMTFPVTDIGRINILCYFIENSFFCLCCWVLYRGSGPGAELLRGEHIQLVEFARCRWCFKI